MNKEVIFPKKEEIEVIALKKISQRPSLSMDEARRLSYEELLGVIPKSLTQSPIMDASRVLNNINDPIV